MWRALGVLVGLILLGWIEFESLPGHTYLGSTSQLYVPILEYLDAPNYLTRDLIATHPSVSLTVYDEATLLLRDVGRVDFRRALAAQQVLCRLAALLGIFFLARACGARSVPSMTVAALIGLGTYLPGVNAFVIDPEPVPRAFAIGFVTLAIGFLAQEKPLLCGLFAGLALLYDPAIASPFWLLMLVAFAFDRAMRKLLKPLLPVFLVFLLLLANLAQLQPGTPDARGWFTPLSTEAAALAKFRSPDLWISLWPGKFIHLYLACFVLGIWALVRIWSGLNRPTRWLLAGLPALSLLTMPVSLLLLECLHWPAVLRAQPMQALIYTVLLSWMVFALAALRAWRKQEKREAAGWGALCLLILVPGIQKFAPPRPDPALLQLASWADTDTWGSSMFLFPDAGRELYPGVFRAESRRALWVDWESGRQMNSDIALAPEWGKRWHGTMEGPLTGAHLQQMLGLPIDYYVFKRGHSLATLNDSQRRSVKPVFANDSFAVYEASTLRLLPGSLTVSDTSSSR